MSDNPADTTKLVLCPYCGHAQHGGERCQNCAGLFEPLSRRATQLAMGPWQIRDKVNPFRPGCCYDVIKKMATSGKIKPHSVMRGPTTRQFWSVARNVPGIAHLIGYCHECGHHVSPSDAKCGECGTSFNEPRERNTLGLVYKDDDEAMFGQRMLEAEMKGDPMPPRQMPGPTKRTKPRPAKPGDLLADVLDLSGDVAPPPASSPSFGSTPSRPQPRQPAGAMSATVTAPPAGPSKPTPSGFGSPPSMQPGTGSPQGMNTPPSMTPTSAFDTEPTKPLPDGEGISPMVWLLIGANVVALAAIVVFVLFNQ